MAKNVTPIRGEHTGGMTEVDVEEMLQVPEARTGLLQVYAFLLGKARERKRKEPADRQKRDPVMLFVAQLTT